MTVLRKKIQHLLLEPIHVFLFHQVGEVYDSGLCNPCDWTQIENFKKKVLDLSRDYVFVSLSEALRYMKRDCVRRKKYAVLTNDDGSASLKLILPWLKEHHIPISLFINGKYMDGVSFREKPTERYLNREEVFALDYDGIEICHHGWEHNDITRIEWVEFVNSVEMNSLLLQDHPRYLPAWAYTWGRHTKMHDNYLLSRGITPVLIDGMKNYADTIIHRELIDG